MTRHLRRTAFLTAVSALAGLALTVAPATATATAAVAAISTPSPVLIRPKVQRRSSQPCARPGPW